MRDYIRTLSSVKMAISAREGELRTHNASLGGLQSWREKLDKQRSSEKEDKVVALAREVAEAEEAVNFTKSECVALGSPRRPSQSPSVTMCLAWPSAHYRMCTHAFAGTKPSRRVSMPR